MTKLTTLLLALTLATACTKKGPSEVCDSDGQCEDGLSCEDVKQGADCTPFSMQCTKSCATDADCSDLGDDFRCFADCDGVSTCGSSEVKTSDLPASAVCEMTDACSAGLECLPVSQHGATECTVVGLACSITCTTDADCAGLGANFKCFESCDGESVCGATG